VTEGSGSDVVVAVPSVTGEDGGTTRTEPGGGPGEAVFSNTTDASTSTSNDDHSDLQNRQSQQHPSSSGRVNNIEPFVVDKIDPVMILRFKRELDSYSPNDILGRIASRALYRDTGITDKSIESVSSILNEAKFSIPISEGTFDAWTTFLRDMGTHELGYFVNYIWFRVLRRLMLYRLRAATDNGDQNIIEDTIKSITLFLEHFIDKFDTLKHSIDLVSSIDWTKINTDEDLIASVIDEGDLKIQRYDGVFKQYQSTLASSVLYDNLRLQRTQLESDISYLLGGEQISLHAFPHHAFSSETFKALAMSVENFKTLPEHERSDRFNEIKYKFHYHSLLELTKAITSVSSNIERILRVTKTLGYTVIPLIHNLKMTDDDIRDRVNAMNISDPNIIFLEIAKTLRPFVDTPLDIFEGLKKYTVNPDKFDQVYNMIINLRRFENISGGKDDKTFIPWSYDMSNNTIVVEGGKERIVKELVNKVTFKEQDPGGPEVTTSKNGFGLRSIVSISKDKGGSGVGADGGAYGSGGGADRSGGGAYGGADGSGGEAAVAQGASVAPVDSGSPGDAGAAVAPVDSGSPGDAGAAVAPGDSGSPGASVAPVDSGDSGSPGDAGAAAAPEDSGATKKHEAPGTDGASPGDNIDGGENKNVRKGLFGGFFTKKKDEGKEKDNKQKEEDGAPPGGENKNVRKGFIRDLFTKKTAEEKEEDKKQKEEMNKKKKEERDKKKKEEMDKTKKGNNTNTKSFLGRFRKGQKGSGPYIQKGGGEDFSKLLKTQREKELNKVRDNLSVARKKLMLNLKEVRKNLVTISYPTIGLYSNVLEDFSDFQRMVERILDNYVSVNVVDEDDDEAGRSALNSKRGSTRLSSKGFLTILANRASISQVHIIYMIKLIRTITQLLILYVTEYIFAEHYMRKVHVNTLNDPDALDDVPLKHPDASLVSFLLIFLVLDIIIQVIILVALVIVMYTYAKSSNTFVIDSAFISDIIIEFVMQTLIFTVLGFVIAKIMMKKRFFEYPTRGIAVSKAYRNMMMSIAVVTTAIPYTMLFK